MTQVSYTDARRRIKTSLDLAIFETLRKETDRAAALLGAAYLDSYLADMFRVKLHADAPKALFENRGPLADFASKIDLAYSLGWLSADIRTDLHIIRKIRNNFAHSANHLLSFSAQAGSDPTVGLKVRAKWMKLFEGKTDSISMNVKARLGTPRGRFECAVAETAAFVMRALGHGYILTGPYPDPPPRPD